MNHSNDDVDEAREALGGALAMARGADAEDLRASEERFRLLADNISQLAWMADARGWIFWYNRRWFEYTGTTLKEMEGWGWRNVHHPAHVDRVVERIQHSFDTGRAWEDTFPLRSKTGEYRWFLSRALPLRNEAGELVCWFGTNTDVTEQRDVEQRLRESDRRKNEFIAMLGHELRNPLAAIRGATAIIAGAPHEQTVLKQALNVLERQSNHMARLVDGLLDASRIAHGKLHLVQAPLELRALVAPQARDQSVAAKARGLNLVLQSGLTPLWVFGDSTRLTQVVENLLSNAIKFSRAPADVTLRLEQVGAQAVITVTDQGAGIRPEMLERIFQPFEQESQDASRSAGGLGLGLAVAKGLVELHGGTIEAKSAGAGTGAQFTVRLPLIAAPPTAVAAAHTARDSAPQRILIIEDNVDAGVMLSLLLRRRGHHATLVHTAREGIDQLRAHGADVVLCDLGLPDMTGHDFVRAIRADQELAGAYVIATTGYGQPRDLELSREAGFDAHLTKPIELLDLDRLLAQRPRTSRS